MIAKVVVICCVLSVAVATVNSNGGLSASVAADVPGATVLENDTVASYLVSRGDMNVLLAAVGLIPNLTETLAQPGSRFTVFAPTDNAFANLARSVLPMVQFDQGKPEEIVGVLMKGVEMLRDVASAGYPELRNVLMYHMIGEALSSVELEKRKRVITMQGDKLTFADGVIIDGDDSRGNVSAAPKDVFVQNGWANVIHDVLLPFNLTKALSAIVDMPMPTEMPVMTAAPMMTPMPIAKPGEMSEEMSGTMPEGEMVGPMVVETDEFPMTSEEEQLGVSPEPRAEGQASCFPADASIHMADGSTRMMTELSAGHVVQTDENKGASAVFLFTHKTAEKKSVFYQLTTASGHSVSMTGGHYLYANSRLVSADAVRVGDVLRTVAGNSPVVAVRRVHGNGLYAPHTVHGDMVVDGIVVSGYSKAVHPKVAHALLAPLRALVKWGGLVEPLGALFYEGGDRLAALVPSGSARY